MNNETDVMHSTAGATIDALKLELVAAQAALAQVRDVLCELRYEAEQSGLRVLFRVDRAIALAERHGTEPVGEVIRYGADSAGRMWHSVNWYGHDFDIPQGTKLYALREPT